MVVQSSVSSNKYISLVNEQLVNIFLLVINKNKSAVLHIMEILCNQPPEFQKFNTSIHKQNCRRDKILNDSLGI